MIKGKEGMVAQEEKEVDLEAVDKEVETVEVAQEVVMEEE